MKFVKRIGLFLCLSMCILCLGIFCGMAVSEFFYPGRNRELSKRAEAPQNSAVTQPEESVRVDAQKLILNAETEYVLQKTDAPEGTVTETSMKLPEKYIGMDREEFLSSMEIFELSPPLAEQEKGFVGLEVLTFSPQRVVVQMNYALEDAGKDYFILVEDHYLVVYLGDRKTLFMYTEIRLEDLPYNIRQQVIDGLYMESEERLYDFLESYSS